MKLGIFDHIHTYCLDNALLNDLPIVRNYDRLHSINLHHSVVERNL
jgi:hypothetical protein